MKSHQVIRDSFEKASPKEIAAELGVSLSLVYKWAEAQSTDGSGSRNPLDRVMKIIETTDDCRIVEWLCREAGGYFVRNPDGSHGRGLEVLPATQGIVSQFAALLSQISTAAMDDQVTHAEAAEIRRCWDRLKSHTEGFVRCCEDGDFNNLRRTLPQG
jgi:hypothetical protein